MRATFCILLTLCAAQAGGAHAGQRRGARDKSTGRARGLEGTPARVLRELGSRRNVLVIRQEARKRKYDAPGAIVTGTHVFAARRGNERYLEKSALVGVEGWLSAAVKTVDQPLRIGKRNALFAGRKVEHQASVAVTFPSYHLGVVPRGAGTLVTYGGSPLDSRGFVGLHRTLPRWLPWRRSVSRFLRSLSGRVGVMSEGLRADFTPLAYRILWGDVADTPGDIVEPLLWLNAHAPDRLSWFEDPLYVSVGMRGLATQQPSHVTAGVRLWTPETATESPQGATGDGLRVEMVNVGFEQQRLRERDGVLTVVESR